MGAPVVSRIPAVAAGDPLNQTVMVEDERSTGAASVAKAAFVPDTAQVAAGATNFATLQLRRRRAGSAVATVGSINLGTVALTAEVPADFTMAADSDTAVDDVIDVHVVQTGTGGAVPSGTVEVEFA